MKYNGKLQPDTGAVNTGYRLPVTVISKTVTSFLNNGADMWPLYYINKNMNGNEGDLTLCGSFPTGTTLTISVMQYSEASYELFADDTLAASFSVAGDIFDETGLTIKKRREAERMERRRRGIRLVHP